MRTLARQVPPSLSEPGLLDSEARTPPVAVGLGLLLIAVLVLASEELGMPWSAAADLLGPRSALILCSMGLLALSLGVAGQWRRSLRRLARRTSLLEKHLAQRVGREQATLEHSQEFLRTQTGELRRTQEELRARDERLARALQALRERTLRLHELEDKLSHARRALRSQLGQRKLLLAGLSELSATVAQEPSSDELLSLARADTSPSLPFEAALEAVEATALPLDEELFDGAYRSESTRVWSPGARAALPTPVETFEDELEASAGSGLLRFSRQGASA